MNNTNPWNIGPLNKQGLWSYYSIGNTIGVVEGCLLFYILNFSPDRKPTANKVGVSGLISGCVLMSLPCATQCFLNLISGTDNFQYGQDACFWEAFFHISAIMVQFLSIAYIGFSSYLRVSYRYEMSVRSAWITIALIWIISEVSVWVAGIYSETELLPSGAYCFSDFKSPVIMLFSITMVSAFTSVIFSYCKILIITRRTEAKITTSERKAHKVAQRTFINVVVFFFGWIFGVIGCIYAIATGRITVLLDVLLGVFGTAHSIIVPPIYAYGCEDVKKWLFRHACCLSRFSYYKRERRGKRSVITLMRDNPPGKYNLKVIIDRPQIVITTGTVSLPGSARTTGTARTPVAAGTLSPPETIGSARTPTTRSDEKVSDKKPSPSTIDLAVESSLPNRLNLSTN